jgi:hypothetical protein
MATGRSRYNKYSIMSNSGFGDLVIRRDGISITIPQELITKDGSVHKRIQLLMDKEDYKGLRERGVSVR